MNDFELTLSPTSRPRLLYATRRLSSSGRIERIFHKHEDFCEIVFVTGGEGSYIHGGNVYQIKKGDVFFANKGIPHEDSSSERGDYENICFGVAGLQFMGLPEGIFTLPGQSVVRDAESLPELFFYANKLYEASMVTTAYSERLRDSMLTATILLAANLPDKGNCEDQEENLGPAMLMRHFIDINFADDISLDDMTQFAGVTRFHGSHLFKDTFGMSPVKYLVRRRIGQAQTLLIATNMSVREIAWKVGYPNSDYFCSLFKKKVGHTPREYRKQYLTNMTGKRTQ